MRNLRQNDVPTAILSNGTPDMLAAAVESAGIGDLLDAVLSVDSLRLYKPSAAVYDMVGERFSVARAEVLLVSSNGWDVAGAAQYGFRTLWVNRTGEPVDILSGQPERISTGLPPFPKWSGYDQACPGARRCGAGLR